MTRARSNCVEGTLDTRSASDLATAIPPARPPAAGAYACGTRRPPAHIHLRVSVGRRLGDLEDEGGACVVVSRTARRHERRLREGFVPEHPPGTERAWRRA